MNHPKIFINKILMTNLKGSESCPSRGLLFGLFARGQPDKLLCEL